MASTQEVDHGRPVSRSVLALLGLLAAFRPGAVQAQSPVQPGTRLGATRLVDGNSPAPARGPLMARARRHRWMPIVRIAYRQVRVGKRVAPGGGVDALFPVALVGDGWSRVRFGPVFGSGIDVAVDSTGFGPSTRHVDVHGALGVALRVGRPRTDRALLTTVTWRPTLRRSGGEGYDGPDQRISAAHGRFDLGAVFGHFGFGAFVGLARWGGVRERETGVHLGLAW